MGWALGCGLGFAVAVAIDRLPFFQRGLAAGGLAYQPLPLVGVRTIAVMWFGFEWPSKAAVVVLMTFFPMLVSTLAGLQAAGKLERELMYSYAASYSRAPCGAAPAGSAALHLWRTQGQCHAGLDRRHRG
jgi:NitT/TauT family transport system permease protein